MRNKIEPFSIFSGTKWLGSKKIISGILISIFYLLIASCHAQTLKDYLLEAAENNPSVKASYTEFEASLKRASQVNALPDPNLSFGYFISPIETRVGAQQAKFSLTQMFPWFGTLKAKEKVATWQAEAKYQVFLNDKNQLFYQVKQAYYPLYEVHDIINLQKRDLEILESFKQLATISFANGKGTMTNVLRVDIMMDDIITDIQLLEDKLDPLTTAFNRLLNRPDNSIIQIDDSLRMEVFQLDFFKDSISSKNPKIKALEKTLASLKAQETVAQKSGLPQLGVGLDYAFIGERTDMNIADNGKNAFMPMVTMSIPIFRKKHKSAVEESQMLQMAMEYKIEGMENQLITQFEKAYYEAEKALQLDSLYEKQRKKTEQVLRLLYTAYSNSGRDFEEVLRMQQQLLKYQMAQATVKVKYFIALAQLEYITADE